MKPSFAFTTLALAAFTIPALKAELPKVTPESAPSIAELIAPTADEDAWLQIPWEVDLAAARKKAAAAGKPIFLWEMDGHPLGCV
jgi:hypothetical protein